MNYSEKYQNLINFRKNNPPPADSYCEVHHIQPLSLWGSDDADNKVKLTAAEHLRAHYFLLKSAIEKGWPITLAKMLPAFQLMSHRAGVIPELSETELEEIGNEYQQAKEYASFVNGIMNRGAGNPHYGKHHKEESRQKISVTHSGERNPMYGKKHTEESKRKIGEGNSGEKNYNFGKRGELSHNYGRKHTEEELEKIRRANLGKTYTEETKKRISESKIGSKNPSFGKRWWTNGQEEIFSHTPPTGFVAGRLKLKSK